MFKALADSNRRSLLEELDKNNGQTLGELCRHLKMSRQAVTKHLAVLQTAGLIVTLWQGRFKHHYLNPAPFRQIAEDWIERYQRRIPLALSELEEGIERIAGTKKGGE